MTPHMASNSPDNSRVSRLTLARGAAWAVPAAATIAAAPAYAASPGEGVAIANADIRSCLDTVFDPFPIPKTRLQLTTGSPC